jgi:D-alanyl-D-alanine carboxypeptidase
MTCRRIPLFLVLICLSARGARGFGDQLDAYLAKEMQARRIPGLAFAVIDKGKVMKRAYGMANLETDTPVRTDSVFELASVTKPFTATAIMMLVEEGKIALDDAIARYLDHTPEAWRGMTVRHLLTHTAGLPEHAFNDCMDTSAQQQFDSVAKASQLFPPGEAFQYSDPGYFLLGMIIEKASGQKYGDFLHKRVFDPLQMTSSHVLDQRRVVKGRVAPYTMRRGTLERGRRDWQHELPSHYGVWSTIDDLIKWDNALANESLVKESTLAQMWAPATLRSGHPVLVDGLKYGLGWFVRDTPGHRLVGHPGYSGTVMLRLTDDRLTVIVLTNLDVAAGSHPFIVAVGIARLVRPALIEFLNP